MELITRQQQEQLLRNGKITQERGDAELIDHKPVVKLFTPDAGATWLLSELQADGDTAFGLCDLGVGHPELGYVLLSEIASVRGCLGLAAQRDVHFTADETLGAYSRAARAAQRIIV